MQSPNANTMHIATPCVLGGGADRLRHQLLPALLHRGCHFVQRATARMQWASAKESDGRRDMLQIHT